MRIFAVIVTYNRLSKLVNAVAAVKSQVTPPEKVFVINNNSNDGTKKYLDDLNQNDPAFVPVHLDTNMGGAGGFYHGVKAAYEAGADWIWMMDDDCVPASNALEKLLSGLGRIIETKNDGQHVGFVASRVTWTDGSTCNMNIPCVARDWVELHGSLPWISRVRNASFVSVLVNSRVIDVVGYPVKEFFIWFDDVEYTRRISNRYGSYYIADSVVTHDTGENTKPADYRYISDGTVRKFCYGLRNECAYAMQQKFGIVKASSLLLSRFLTLLLIDKKYKHKLMVMWWGLKGFFFNYRKLIEYPAGPDAQ